MLEVTYTTKNKGEVTEILKGEKTDNGVKVMFNLLKAFCIIENDSLVSIDNVKYL